MLKISQSELADKNIILKLEGRVVGPWVGEFSELCKALLTQGRAVKLDLADVSFADKSGVMTLCNLQSRGVILSNCSLFLEEQLKRK